MRALHAMNVANLARSRSGTKSCANNATRRKGRVVRNSAKTISGPTGRQTDGEDLRLGGGLGNEADQKKFHNVTFTRTYMTTPGIFTTPIAAGVMTSRSSPNSLTRRTRSSSDVLRNPKTSTANYARSHQAGPVRPAALRMMNTARSVGLRVSSTTNSASESESASVAAFAGFPRAHRRAVPATTAPHSSRAAHARIEGG